MTAGMLAWNTDVHFVYIDIAGSGLLVGEAEKQGKIVVSTELGGGGQVIAPTHRVAASGLANVLRHFGVLEGKVETRESLGLEPAVIVRATDEENYLLAPESGLWETLRRDRRSRRARAAPRPDPLHRAARSRARAGARAERRLSSARSAGSRPPTRATRSPSSGARSTCRSWHEPSSRGRARRHHAAARAAARLLGGAQGARAGRPGAHDRAGARLLRRRADGGDRRHRPRLRRGRPRRDGSRAGDPLDRDPRERGLRPRLSQPQRAQPLSRLDGRRPARRAGVRALCRLARRSARRRRLRRLAPARARAHRRRGRYRSGPLRQPRRPRAPGRRLAHRDPHRPRRRRAPGRPRELRRAPDHGRRHHDPVGRRVHRARSRDGRVCGSRRRVHLPAGLRGRHRAVRLVVRRLRGEPARLRGPGSPGSRDRRGGARAVPGDRDERRRPRGGGVASGSTSAGAATRTTPTRSASCRQSSPAARSRTGPRSGGPRCTR